MATPVPSPQPCTAIYVGTSVGGGGGGEHPQMNLRLMMIILTVPWRAGAIVWAITMKRVSLSRGLFAFISGSSILASRSGTFAGRPDGVQRETSLGGCEIPLERWRPILLKHGPSLARGPMATPRLKWTQRPNASPSSLIVAPFSRASCWASSFPSRDPTRDPTRHPRSDRRSDR